MNVYINYNNIKMLYYDRIDVSDRIDIIKTSASKECDTCYCWHFLNKGFKFQIYVWNECHDLLMISMNFSNIVFSKIKKLVIVVLLLKLAKLNL